MDTSFLADEFERLAAWLADHGAEGAPGGGDVFHMVFFSDEASRAEAERRLVAVGYTRASIDRITPDDGDPFVFWLEMCGRGVDLGVAEIERHVADTLGHLAGLEHIYNGFHLLVVADGRVFEP